MDLDDAIDNLRIREGTSTKNIGVWRTGEPAPELVSDLPVWAKIKGADAVIWTALPPKFQNEVGRVPSPAEAINYLCSLENEYQRGAEEYVRKAPVQIRTRYRVEFEKNLGWYPE